MSADEIPESVERLFGLGEEGLTAEVEDKLRKEIAQNTFDMLSDMNRRDMWDIAWDGMPGVNDMDRDDLLDEIYGWWETEEERPKIAEDYPTLVPYLEARTLDESKQD
jgi:hypothetical protein